MLFLGSEIQRSVFVFVGGVGAGPLIRNSPAAREGSPGLARRCWEPALTQRGQHSHGHQEQGQEEVENPHGCVQRQVLLAAAAVQARPAC